MRRVWRQVKQKDGTSKLVELTNLPPKLPEDLRFDGSFVSPVDGSIIRNKHDLVRHNSRNGVAQVLPGVHEDVVRNREEEMSRRAKEDRQERIEIIKHELERGGL